jgi:hypothetical protein
MVHGAVKLIDDSSSFFLNAAKQFSKYYKAGDL